MTVGLACQHPDNVHMQPGPGFGECLNLFMRFFHKKLAILVSCLRLRAAIFINACAMRDAVNLQQGPLLTPENSEKLETANYLFHSALNCALAAVLY